MRIDDHVLLGLVTGIVIYVALSTFIKFDQPLFLLATLFLGLFYPDVDAPKARWSKIIQDTSRIGLQRTAQIYKEKRRARDTKNFFLFLYSILLMCFGYFMRIFIYLPLVVVLRAVHKQWLSEYEVKDEHRGLSHSLFGLILSVIVFGVYLFLLKKYWVPASNISLILCCSVFLLGGLIHLVQDSTTRSGVRWLYPFKQTSIRGNHSAFDYHDQRPKILTFVMLILFGICWLAVKTNNLTNMWLLVSASILVLGSYAIFFRICRIEIRTQY